jgi:PTH1 family peptidyl-tRNA hydrolase
MDKKLIVGLGNASRQYKNTRHNVGFMVIDHLCEKLNCDLSYEMFNGSFGKAIIHDNECFIAKPLTYMNLSGDFVSQIINYLKISLTNVIVICDDVNLELGQIRIRKSGSSGGQNGLKDIINKVHSEDFIRIRIGIGRPTNKKIDLADYVLSKFEKKEEELVKQTIVQVTKAISDFMEHQDIEKLMNQYN